MAAQIKMCIVLGTVSFWSVSDCIPRGFQWKFWKHFLFIPPNYKFSPIITSFIYRLNIWRVGSLYKLWCSPWIFNKLNYFDAYDQFYVYSMHRITRCSMYMVLSPIWMMLLYSPSKTKITQACYCNNAYLWQVFGQLRWRNDMRAGYWWGSLLWRQMLVWLRRTKEVNIIKHSFSFYRNRMLVCEMDYVSCWAVLNIQVLLSENGMFPTLQ
jgi:hypothetical protein